MSLIDPGFLEMVGSKVTNQPVPIEMDQRKRNHLHPVAGSDAARTGAGLFTNGLGVSRSSGSATRICAQLGMRAGLGQKRGLTVGNMPDPHARTWRSAHPDCYLRHQIRETSKKRQNAFRSGMPYPRVIPHSDGAGVIDLIGGGVAAECVGRRVWCYGAQSYRPFGTAAEYAVVPIGKRGAAPG